MKINLIKNKFGLFEPLDNNLEKANKIPIGEPFSVDVKFIRDYETHKRYFAFILLVWNFLTEEQREGYKNSLELFREYLQCSCAHTKLGFTSSGEIVEVAQSIAYENLDELQFKELYRMVKEICWKKYISTWDELIYNDHFKNFYEGIN